MHELGALLPKDGIEKVFNPRPPEILMLIPRAEGEAIDTQPVKGVHLAFFSRESRKPTGKDRDMMTTSGQAARMPSHDDLGASDDLRRIDIVDHQDAHCPLSIGVSVGGGQKLPTISIASYRFHHAF